MTVDTSHQDKIAHGAEAGRNELHQLDASRGVPFNMGEGAGKRGRARVAAYQISLGEAKELIVALDCIEIDQLAPLDEVIAAQDLADRIAAMLTKLIRSAETTSV